MSAINVTTQEQLDKALKNLKPGDWVVCLGGTWDDPLVVSGSASVTASGSARVEASGSASVTAYESARVEAYGSARVTAFESARVTASRYVSVHKHGTTPTVSGGVVIDVPDPATLAPADWCDYYGVTVSRGYAVLFKAVDDDYSTPNARAKGLFYTPGAKITAPDWKPTNDCGGGLHVSPRPFLARDYNEDASRYVQVKVKVSDLVVIGDKAKTPRLTVVCECDLDGEPVADGEAA